MSDEFHQEFFVLFFFFQKKKLKLVFEELFPVFEELNIKFFLLT